MVRETTRDICCSSQLIAAGLNEILKKMLNGITSGRGILSSVSENLSKGQRELLMDLAVAK